MPSSAVRWGTRLSLLAGGVAVVLSLQPHLFSQQSPLGPHHDGAPEEIHTYCYQSVRATATDPGNNNCFSVSSKNGTFTRVFSSPSSSSSSAQGGGEEEVEENGGYEIRKGHVLPGLWDGHGHLIQYGEFLHSADLFGADSPGEVRRRLRAYLDANPGVGTRGTWARGIGWDQMVLGGMPFAVRMSHFASSVIVLGVGC